MTEGATVLCAVDLGPLTGRVVYHAAGLARVMGLSLKVLHVAKQVTPNLEAAVAEACEHAAPYDLPLDGLDVIVRSGEAAAVLAHEAAANRASIIVMGTNTHTGLMKRLLGSTSASVLEQTLVPVLLVPPMGMDIVTFSDRAALICGTVLAPVDLAEPSDRQVQMASRMAALGGHPLVLMTVAGRDVSDQDAAAQLRQRARAATPVEPAAIIVRRGEVTEEISRCAVSEGAGLAVMGLRARQRGQPGRLAASVLKTGSAFVLAVPN